LRKRDASSKKKRAIGSASRRATTSPAVHRQPVRCDIERRVWLLEGYEGSVDGGRDRWLIILEPGDRAVFIY